jgi:arsenite-transporting ATPase
VSRNSNLYALEIDASPEQDMEASSDTQESFLSELTSAIPGIDEAMARPLC